MFFQSLAVWPVEVIRLRLWHETHPDSTKFLPLPAGKGFSLQAGNAKKHSVIHKDRIGLFPIIPPHAPA
jgi:hypothetical protein